MSRISEIMLEQRCSYIKARAIAEQEAQDSAPPCSETETALRMAKEGAVNAALTGKPRMAKYYLRKAAALECAAMDERKGTENISPESAGDDAPREVRT